MIYIKGKKERLSLAHSDADAHRTPLAPHQRGGAPLFAGGVYKVMNVLAHN